MALQCVMVYWGFREAGSVSRGERLLPLSLPPADGSDKTTHEVHIDELKPRRDRIDEKSGNDGGLG